MAKTESKNERSQLTSLNVLNHKNELIISFKISLKNRVICDFFNKNYLSVKISYSIIIIIIGI